MYFRQTFGRLFLQTQFGGVWLWQIVLALVTLIVALMQPRNMPRLLFMLTTAQFILLAGVGHATLNEGVTAKIHQTNHAIHLICAAAWFGGLLPVLWCMQLIKGRWRTPGYSGADAFFLVRAFCGDRRTGKRRA
ncbi:putative copper resistance protein [Escherichia coli]|uniref:Putative copper resistance protein n=1 Tax=Escherichia coli TaxID=562 RepID=A0A376S870_ECOLX|nr:putative copper resistance protein [Escherichia coli]